MSPWIEAAMAKYGWIWIGLTFGIAAKYALLIKRGVRVTPGVIFADVLLLPMVALISYSLVSQFGASDEIAALMTAAGTVGADRLVKLYTEQFFKQLSGAAKTETPPAE